MARVERDLLPEQHIGCSGPHVPALRDGKAVKHGLDRLGRQRFRCAIASRGGCGKTFNTLTATPFARMRKPDRLHTFAKALSNSFISVDRLATLNLGVSRLTIWRWRNRFLEAQARHQAETLSGVEEVDETYFKTSFKGSRGRVRGTPPENRPPRYRGAPSIKRGISKEQIAVLAAVNSAGSIFEVKISGVSDIRPALENRIEPGSILCSDGVQSYVQVAMDTSSEHRRIFTLTRKSKAQKTKGGKPRQKGKPALARVNAHHERMEAFVNRLARGTSTANIATYLGWQRTVGRVGFGPESLLCDALAYQV